jgi:hypothetical protein
VTEAEAAEAVLQHWKPLWEAAHPSVPWRPEDEAHNSEDEWVRISFVPATRANQAVGGARLANGGFVSVQVFVLSNQGSLRGRQLCDSVREILENVTIASPHPDDEPICLYAGEPGAPSRDGKWTMRVVNVRYRYDDIG